MNKVVQLNWKSSYASICSTVVIVILPVHKRFSSYKPFEGESDLAILHHISLSGILDDANRLNTSVR